MFLYKNRFSKKSFSQCGEDSIVEYIFNLREINKPSYIDIGAFHPFSLSNTAKFYLKGSKGINIEPNPKFYKYFKFFRRKDINLNIGVGSLIGKLSYFFMNDDTMNTFDEVIAKDLVENHGFRIEKKINIQTKDLKSIIKEYANNIFPDFLSLDVEGLDFMILQQIDYENNYPKVICVETVEFSKDGNGNKNHEIVEYLFDKGYIKYADTYLNSIFINKKFWDNKDYHL